MALQEDDYFCVSRYALIPGVYMLEAVTELFSFSSSIRVFDTIYRKSTI